MAARFPKCWSNEVFLNLHPRDPGRFPFFVPESARTAPRALWR